MPVSAGVASFAAARAWAHRFLAGWLAPQLFTRLSHINWVRMGMLSTEPWLYAAVAHESQQTHHGIEICLEPGSTGAKEVSILPSLPTPNLISGGGHLPKLGAPELLESEAASASVELFFGAVECEEVWRTGQEKSATTAYETDLCPWTGFVVAWSRTDRNPEGNVRQREHQQCHKRDNSRSPAVPHRE